MGRFDTHDDNDNAWVGVDSSGTHRNTDTPVASEFLIQEKGQGGERVHLGFDEDGDQIFESRK